MNSLAICAIFRDEAPYLDEWLRFHRAMGANHFFLYDNQSTDSPLGVLRPFIDAGWVTVIDWPVPFHQRAQIKAYTNCLARTRGHHRWVAFIDIDEFVFSPTGKPLPQILQAFEAYPGVVAHWRCYGSGGLQESSDLPVTGRFTRRGPDGWVRNRKVKSIVNPERTTNPASVHHFDYLDGELAVDESGRRVDFRAGSRSRKSLKRVYGRLGPLLRILPIDPYTGREISGSRGTASLLRVNHYPVKSREEFLLKARKASLKKERRRYEDVDYFAYHDRNEVEDPILVGFSDRVQSA